MTRILHVITTLDRGGAETAVLHLAGEQAAEHDVAIAYLKGSGELASHFEGRGVGVHDLAFHGLRGVGAYGRAKRLVRSWRPDVIHTHLFKADCLGAALAGAHRPDRVRLVSTKHNEDVYLRSPGWRAVGRRVAARADALVAITTGVARFIAAELGAAPRHVVTIPYGVPAPVGGGDGPAFRTRHGIPLDAPLAVCLARFEPQKDHATLLDAFERLDDNAWLALLGRGSLEEQVRARAGARVAFCGFEPNPTDSFVAADVVVLASRHEGLGLVLLEAAQFGVPAVATRVGGISDVVTDGETGLLVPAGDAVALADALRRMLTDLSLRERLGRAAWQRVQQFHAVEDYVAATAALYDDLLEGRP